MASSYDPPAARILARDLVTQAASTVGADADVQVAAATIDRLVDVIEPAFLASLGHDDGARQTLLDEAAKTIRKAVAFGRDRLEALTEAGAPKGLGPMVVGIDSLTEIGLLWPFTKA